MHSKGTVFPVFQGRDIFLPPRFMARFLRKIDIHALQGLKEETVLLESGLSRLGLSAFDRIDYDLMSLDRPPNPNSLHRGPSRLMVRSPEASDLEELFHLQALYEQEEVLPAGAEFFPAACRLSLESILTKERILVAELEGRILGKINTNAASFSRYQIGGVYVLPEYRGLGIGSRLTAEFARSLLASGKGVTLFVKKRNHSARNVYRRIGFIAFADYRITYY
jgi:ribosomal protein S18 acetylase RimI-like enzyme